MRRRGVGEHRQDADPIQLRIRQRQDPNPHVIVVCGKFGFGRCSLSWALEMRMLIPERDDEFGGSLVEDSRVESACDLGLKCGHAAVPVGAVEVGIEVVVGHCVVDAREYLHLLIGRAHPARRWRSSLRRGARVTASVGALPSERRRGWVSPRWLCSTPPLWSSSC